MNVLLRYMCGFFLVVLFGYASFLSAYLPAGTKIVYPNGTVYTESPYYQTSPYGNTTPPYGYNYQNNASYPYNGSGATPPYGYNYQNNASYPYNGSGTTPPYGYNNPTNAPLPYGGTTPPYGYNYQGYNYFTSPPPPTPNQAFPDDARQNALYNQIRNR